MTNQESKYTEFNWKKFFKIAGSAFFIFLGATLGITSKGSLFQLIFSFALASTGIALMFIDY